MNTQAIKKREGVQTKIYENVSYKLVDKNGKAKSVFALNGFGMAIMRFMRKLVKSPIGKDGQVKSGIFNHLSAYGLRVPFLCGNWVGEMKIANLMTNTGFAGVASRINGADSEAAFTYIAVGTGTTSAAAADSALETEITDSGLERATGTASRVTTTQTNDTAQLVKTFTVTGTKAVTESGVLNAGSSGVLLCHQVFSAINVVSGDSLQITWKIKAS